LAGGLQHSFSEPGAQQQRFHINRQPSSGREEERFRGFACSECSWRLDSSVAPTGKSFDEMMRNFELQRDKEFASHVCVGHTKTAGSKHSI